MSTPRRPTAARSIGGDGRIGDRARPRVSRHHRPLAAPDRGQRPVARASARRSWTRSRALNAELARFGCSPGSRSTSTRTARSTSSPSAGPARRRGRQRPFGSCGWGGADDRAHGHRARQPEPRHPRPLHRPDEDRASEPAASRPSTPELVFAAAAPIRQGDRDQLAARAPGSAEAAPAPGGRGRLSGLDRLRRARVRSSFWLGQRLPAGVPVRRHCRR